MAWKRRLKRYNHIRDTAIILEPCNFTLNIFQDFVFTYSEQERQYLCNYRLFRPFQGVNKAENQHWIVW